MPTRTRLLCIDTGDYSVIAQGEAQLSFAGVSLAVDEIIELKGNLEDYRADESVQSDPLFRAWLTPDALTDLMNNTRLDLLKGAGGERLLARAAFLDHLRADDNLFERMLRLAPPTVPAPGEPNAGLLNVVLVGDTFGDVSSAIVFDVALLVREAGRRTQAQRISVNAHLVTDAAVAHTTRDHDRDAVNTGALLREIERFQLAQARPFPIFYPQIATDPSLGVAVCDSLPLDDLFLYDGRNNLPRDPTEPIDPTLGVYPAVADTIALWMDTAAFRGRLGRLTDEQHQRLNALQNEYTEVLASTQNIATIRLPLADLIETIRRQFEETLVRLLLMGAAVDEGEPRIDAALNQERFGKSGTDPRQLAREFVTGALRLESVPLSDKLRTALTQLMVRQGALPRVPEANVGELLSGNLRQMLEIILNGTQETNGRPDGIYVARGGKLGFALKFVEQVREQAAYQRQVLKTDYSTAASHDVLDSGLQVLDQSALTYANSLTQAANSLLLGLPIDASEVAADGNSTAGRNRALLALILSKRTDLAQQRAEMNRVYNRRYIWTDGEDQPLETVWLRTLETKREEALRQFYWQVQADGQVTLMLASAPQPVGLSAATLTEFEAALLEMVTRYCTELYQQAQFDDLLAGTLLRPDRLAALVGELYNSAQTQASVEQTRGTVEGFQHNLILAASQPIANAKDAVKAALKPLDTSSEQQIYELETTDRYMLAISQRAALFSLRSLRSLDDAAQIYRINHDLEPGRQSPRTPLRSAVFEAESVALQLERHSVDRLKLAKKMLHPLVVTALTDSRRVELYALALAAGNIELQQTADPNVQLLVLVDGSTDRPLITDPRLRGARLAPLAAGLLNFVLDHRAFPDDYVARSLVAYQQNQVLRKQLKVWLDNNEWQDWIDRLPETDTLNRAIVFDLLKVARLYAANYKL